MDGKLEAAIARPLPGPAMSLPRRGSILLSLADRTKPEALGLIRDLAAAGYRLCATAGTAAMIRAMDLAVEQVPKRIEEGHPNVVDVIQDGLVDAVINTPEGRVTETL